LIMIVSSASLNMVVDVSFNALLTLLIIFVTVNVPMPPP
jgi:hypothetical protein